jgi:hypothetical protein
MSEYAVVCHWFGTGLSTLETLELPSASKQTSPPLTLAALAARIFYASWWKKILLL